MFSYLVYSRDPVVYIRVWKTFPRLLYLDERCENILSKISFSYIVEETEDVNCCVSFMFKYMLNGEHQT